MKVPVDRLHKNDKHKTKAELVAELAELRRLLGKAREQKDHECSGDTIHTLEVKDYREVFDGANDGILIHDVETAEVLSVNLKTCEMFGYAYDEIMRGVENGSFPPYASEEALHWVKRAATDGPQIFEWPAKTKSGRLFWLEVTLKRTCLGGKDFVLGVIRDVDERKRVERELQGTRDYLRTVFNNVYDAIFIHDLDGKVIDVNDKLLELYRVSREEAIQLSIIPDYSAPDNSASALPSLWRNVMSGENQFFEWKAKRPKDGSVFDVEVFLTKVSLPDGDFILANVHDITESKRVERELQGTRDYLRTVFNNVYDAIFIHDLDGKVVDVNDKMLELYRVSREEAIQLSIIPDYSTPDYFTDKELSSWALFNWTEAISGKNQFFEWKAKRPKDGSVFDVEVFLTRVSLPDGDFILANVRDISERKRMENLLVKERGVFFSVMEDNPHGIALFDNDGRFVYFNPEFTHITGYALEDIPTGRDWVLNAYPEPAYRDKVVQFWKADRLPVGRGKDVEWVIACKNGRRKDVEFRVTYLGDKSLVVLTDTTARKRAEQELQAEKQKFQTLSESSPVGMIMIGSDNNNKYLNPKFKELFGYDLADIPTAKDWFLAAYPDPFYRRQTLSQWPNYLKSAKPGEGRPYTRRVTCKDGTEKHVNFIPVRLETGEILMTCEDITKSKEAEDKIRERNLELEVLNSIIASVSSSLHLPEILEILKRVLLEKLEVFTGGIFFYDEFTNKLTTEMCWGVPDESLSDFEAFVTKNYGAGPCAREVVLVKNHLNRLGSADFLLSKFLSKWCNSLCIPLVVKGEIQGLIFLFDNRSDKFHDHQVAFYKTLGQQIGVVIQNARLFNQVRQSHTEMKALSLKLVEVQEAERRYIARELHDEIGQELTGLKLALEMNVLQSEGKEREGLTNAKSVVNTLMILVRELSLNLRPSMLDDLGLLATLPWHFERFGNQANIRVTFKHAGLNDRRFPLAVETAVFRIVQEALTNVVRHAKVNEVIVRLWSDEKIIGAQIEDNGIGFDANAVLKAGNSSGLYGMRERALLLGGQFTIETGPGTGTRLTAELPVDLEAE